MVGTGANDRTLTLPALLAHRARGASDGRLVLDAAGGLIVGALAVTLRPPGWPVLISAASTFLAFGVWGIVDRMIEDVGIGARTSRVLRAFRAAAAGLGFLSGVGLVLAAMALMLGTWIS
jgi:hypothetical protein